jgi:hypothetical protein
MISINIKLAIVAAAAPNGHDPARAVPVPIVGIVADLDTADLESAIEPELFLDYLHGNPFLMTVNVRTIGDPRQMAPALRAKLVSIDPTQVLFAADRRACQSRPRFHLDRSMGSRDPAKCHAVV